MQGEHARVWVLVTDGHRARIVVPDAAEGRFRTVLPLGVCAYPYCPPPLRSEIVHPHFGQFAADVASRLNRAAEQGMFEELVLVAPPIVDHDICKLLENTAAARMVGTLGENYAALSDEALSPYIARWWLPPATATEMAGDCAPGAMTL
jgi:hypothetical protein